MDRGLRCVNPVLCSGLGAQMFTLPLALVSLGVENCLRNRSLLGALALRACDVTVRCWGPWCEELFALPIALLFG
eukprot:9503607-Pyramimonas_sp.AAC.1